MMSLRKPSVETIDRFLTKQEGSGFSYSAVGSTATSPPAGYDVDQLRIELGKGATVFDAARAALQRWEQFHLGWIELWPPSTPLEPGRSVAILGKAMGFWWLNACRIVYIVNEAGPFTKFGFAYGTLPEHLERGEERFHVEWDRETDRVSYEIFAFSRPNKFMSRIGYPLVRRGQRRFGRDSAASMLRAVHSKSPAAR
jgi:uncharacterized protein (UPF0548 family)